jgi:hypothetical protein
MEMLQRRCDGHGVLRAYNCGGRAYNWEGRCVIARLTARYVDCNRYPLIYDNIVICDVEYLLIL